MALIVDPHIDDLEEQKKIKYKNLIYLAEIYYSSKEYDKSIECLVKCNDLCDQKEHLLKLAEIYLEKGLKSEFLETTKILISKNLNDKYIVKLHKLACMLNNIQSAQ